MMDYSMTIPPHSASVVCSSTTMYKFYDDPCTNARAQVINARNRDKTCARALTTRARTIMIDYHIKFHEDPFINARARIVNACAHVFTRVRTFMTCARAFVHESS